MVPIPLRIALATAILSLAVATWPDPPASEPDGAFIVATAGCAERHTLIEGAARGIGPDLTRLTEVAPDRVDGLTAEAYVRQSMREPAAFVVDGYPPLIPAIDLAEHEVDAVVQFLLDPS